MSAPRDPARRGFLRGLATLPLVGGSVALIGEPVAAAEPITEELLDYYDSWLFYERRLLLRELYPQIQSRSVMELVRPMDRYGRGDLFHLPTRGPRWNELPQPSSRAALVMAAVGWDWRQPW